MAEDFYATRPQASLSLPIRMEKKRKRTQLGTLATVVGVALLGGSAYNFTQSGSELIATYLCVLGLIVLGVGIAQISKASRGR